MLFGRYTRGFQWHIVLDPYLEKKIWGVEPQPFSQITVSIMLLLGEYKQAIPSFATSLWFLFLFLHQPHFLLATRHKIANCCAHIVCDTYIIVRSSPFLSL